MKTAPAILAAFLALSTIAEPIRQADEPWVLEQITTATNETLQAAKDYTDQHGGAVQSVNGKTGAVVLNAGDVSAYNKTETDTKLAAKANTSGGNIFYNDQWLANGDLNLVAAGFYLDRTGQGQEYIDGRWNGDYWAFMGTRRFLILNGLDFSSAMGAQAPTIDGSPIATAANLASKVSTNSTITIKRTDTPYGESQSLLDYYGLEISKSGTGGGTILLGMSSNTSPYPQLSLYRNAGMYVSETAELIFQGNRSWQDFGLTNAAAAKQDILTAGENITISNNVISATGGSSPSSPGWYIPGDWRVNAEIQNTPEQRIFVDLDTSNFGCVYSNETAQLVYNLAARLSTESLDKYAIDPPPIVEYVSEDPAASISNDVITASSPGLFRVNAFTASGDTRATSVPLSRRPTVSTTATYYATDVAASNSYIKAVNDAAFATLASLVSDGVSREYAYGFYKRWNFPADKITFISGLTSDRHYLISPHVVATADHFPGAYSRNFSATFGSNTLSVIGAGKNTPHCWNLADWARLHGYNDAEINDMHISDIAVFIANSGAASSSDCPYFISQANWELHFGNDGQSLLGWATTQTNPDKKKAAQPVAVKCDCRDSIQFSAAGDLASNPAWRSVVFGGSSLPKFRHDIRAYLDGLGTQPDYWQFPLTFSGDSGSPVFIFHSNRPVLLSHYYTALSGPNWIKALPVLRDFCENQVKETLGLSAGDTIKEIE